MGWTMEHDIFICRLDAKGFMKNKICELLRQVWPIFAIEGLKQKAVEDRLLALDQCKNGSFTRSIAEFDWATELEGANF